MVKRAGLIEAQAGTVGVPQLSGGLPAAATKAYEDLARAGEAISRAMQPMVDNETEERARKAVSEGDMDRAAGVSRQDELYNRIVDAGQMAQGMNDVDRLIGELELKHQSGLNVEEFSKDLAAARATYLKDIDTRYAIPLGQEWDSRANNSTQRISGLATQRAVTRGVEAQKGRQDVLLQQLAGASDVENPEVAMRLEELQILVTARTANPEDGLTQEQADGIILNAISKITANRIGEDALQDYIDGGMTDEAYDASLKRIDEALADPKLTLDYTERSRYRGTARQTLNAARSEKRLEEKELERQIREYRTAASVEFGVMLPDAKSRAAAGFAPGMDELSELMSLAQATGKPRYVAQVNELIQTASIQEQMRGLSIPQQEQYVQALQSAAAAGNADAARQLSSAESVASASRRAAEADPASYAAVTERRDTPAIDWSKPELAVTGMVNRFNEAEVAASTLGVGVKYFSPADRAALKSIMDKGGAEALAFARQIASAADQAGVDPLRVFEEVGEQSPLLAVAGGLMAQDVPDTAERILAGVAVMRTDFVKDKMPSVGNQRAGQLAVLGDQMRWMPPSSIDALTRSADAHYAATLVENGGKPPGGNERAAYEASMRAVSGEWKDGAGRTWGGMADLGSNRRTKTPAWIAQKSFPAVVSALNQNEWATALGLNDDGTLQNEALIRGKDGSQRSATLADVRGALWIEDSPGRYLIAPDPTRPNDVLKNADGVPSIVDLNLARDLLKTRQPDAVR